MILYCVNISCNLFNTYYYVKANTHPEAVAVALEKLGEVQNRSKLNIKTEVLCRVEDIIDYELFTKQ
jgi:hypothetical protein